MEEKVIQYLSEIKEQIRLDQFIAAQNEQYSRSFIQKLIKNGQVSVDGKVQKKPGFLVVFGMQVTVMVPEIKEVNIVPEKMDLDILYEDEDVILVNKPKGMVVHPAPGHYEHTLVNGLMYHCGKELSGINGELRPGIVHRIDMDTTGVIIACKNDVAHRFIAKQLEEHSINRTYQAIVYNNIVEETGVVDQPLGRHPVDRKRMAIVKDGRRAVTHYRVIDHLDGSFNYIECKLETGRTHQIRVHMSSINHPLLGDTVYGPKKNPLNLNLQGQTLHARTLGFIHPRTKEYMEFEAPLPEYFSKILNKFV